MNDDRYNPESEYSWRLDILKNPENLKSWLLAQGFLNPNRENKLGISITKQCFSRIAILTEQLIYKVMVIIRVLSQGFISTSKEGLLSLSEIARSDYNQGRYYCYNITEELTVIIFMGMQKVPFFSQSGKTVQYFQLALCIQFEKIVASSQEQLKQAVIQLDKSKQQSFRFAYKSQDFPVDESRKKPNAQYFNIKQKQSEANLLKKVEIQPHKKLYSSQFDSFDYLFRLSSNKLFASFKQNQQNQQVALKQPCQVEESYDEKQISYTCAKEYVNYISSIPNFKFKLTKQQQQAIGKDGNIIVIGRSGTGKTLLSILRLYSIEYLSKEQKINQQISIKKPKKKCVQNYLNKAFLQKNVFLTASPFLIEEILKQYNDMHYQVQSQHKNTCDECRESLSLKRNVNQDENLQLLLEKIEKRQNVEYPISKIDKKLFPQFLTIKSIIIMIDCGLKRPFFNIRQTKQLKNDKKKAINIYGQSTYRLYQPFENYLNIAFKNKIHLYTKQQLKELKQSDAVLQAVEVTYQYFQKIIWQQISQAYYKMKKGDKGKINPAVVWIQFFSVIKGSAKAHTTHLKCLSPKMYLEQSKNQHLKEQQKIDIYYLFQEYQKWKLRNKAYDLMDVVNHILQEMLFDGYKDQFLDYMFIDQVQDLTPATIYLITKLVKKNVFYCGDTAQAISKGVSFKFSQIKTLFSKKYFKNCIQKEIANEQSNLTVNFRSHNKILMLANAIVSLIQQLFPKMIDTLQKQQSDLFGPPNLIIKNGDERYIYDILLGPIQREINPQNQHANVHHQAQLQQQEQPQRRRQEGQLEQRRQGVQQRGEEEQQEREQPQQDQINSQQQFKIDQDDSISEPSQEVQDKVAKEEQLMKRTLESQQVILVRNNEEKKKLPIFLKKEHILTCEEVKGLQYEDVVIYNFFGSSPCKKKWALLDKLDINDLFIDAKQFQSELSRRAIQQGNSQSVCQLLQESRMELGFNFQKQKYNIHQIKRNQNYLKIDIKKYYQISNELKQFYTLVTRAKHIVIIFDKEVPRQLLRFFQSLNIVKILLPEQVGNIHEKLLQYRNRQSRARYLNKKKLWNEQAMKMLSRKNYDQAIKSFEKAENILGLKRVQAMQIQEQNELQLHQIELQFENQENLSKEEFKMKKVKLGKQRKLILMKLVQAARIFEEIQLPKKAAAIYAKAEQYQKAVDCYLQVQNYYQAAQCYFKLERYAQALENFEKSEEKNIGKMFDCYVKLQKWPVAFQLIKINKQLLKQKLIVNKSMKSSIKLCLKQILDGLLQHDEQLQGEIWFNKGFVDKKRIESQEILRKQIVTKNQKEISQRRQIINSKYNQFLLSYLPQQLTKLKKEYDVLTGTISHLNKQFEQLKQKQDCLYREMNNIQQQIELIDEQFKVLHNKTFYFWSNKQRQHSQLQKKLQSCRLIKRNLRQQFEMLMQKMQNIGYLLKERKQNMEKFDKKYDSKSLGQCLKYAVEFAKRNSQQRNSIPISNHDKELNQSVLSSFIFEDDLVSNFSSSRNREQYRRNANKVYKVWLNEDTVQSLLSYTKEALYLTQNFVDQSEIKFYPIFDHRQIMANVQHQIRKQDYEMKNVLDMYKVLENLNCFSLCYVLCDYYSLKQHLSKTVLSQISLRSMNFREKRRIKDVLNANLQQQQSENIISHLKDNQQTLQSLGKQFLQALCTKRATKQCAYQEYILTDVIQGLVLQGYYENALSFLDENESLKVCFVFMNNKKLMELITPIGVRLRLKQIQKSKEYYFFQDQLANSDNHEYSCLNLVNIFSIQRLFFDFDQCQMNPVLNKRLQIEEIELTNSQIQNCYTLAQYRKGYYQSQVPVKQQQIKQAQENIQQHTQQITKIHRQQHKINKLGKIQIEESKKNIQIYEMEINYSSFTANQLKEEVNYYKTQTDKTTLWKQNYHKSIADMEKKLHQPAINSTYSMQLLLSNWRTEFQQVLAYQKTCDGIHHQLERSLNREIQKVDILTKTRDNLSKQKKDLQDYFARQVNGLQSSKQQIENLIGYRKKIISESQQFIKRYTDPKNAQQVEKQINKQILYQQKYKKIQAFNKQKRQKTLNIIKSGSNLSQMKGESFRFLRYYIKREITRQTIQTQRELRQLIMNIFKYIQSLQSAKITDLQMCQVVVLYLSFLFNPIIRDACICLCQILKEFLQQSQGYIQNYFHQRERIRTQCEKNNKKIEELKKKISNPYNPLVAWTYNRLVQDYNYCCQKGLQLYNGVESMDRQYRAQGYDQLRSDPYSYLQDLLKIHQKIKNVSDKNVKFLQIFLGFFQCRMIKDSKALGFLEGQYVFVEADSILLKKMKEYNFLSFGFYFDCHNKVVLVNFSDAYNTILKYLQKQHSQVYQSTPYLLKFKPGGNESKKTSMMDKSLLGYRNIQDDGKLYKAQLLITIKQQEKKQLQKLYDQYLNNKILTKIRSLNREVLQFYLNNEHKANESFHFVLFQVKQYTNMQTLLQKVTFFNAKMLGQLKKKLKELQQAKDNWIESQKEKYEKELPPSE